MSGVGDVDPTNGRELFQRLLDLEGRGSFPRAVTLPPNSNRNAPPLATDVAYNSRPAEGRRTRFPHAAFRSTVKKRPLDPPPT